MRFVAVVSAVLITVLFNAPPASAALVGDTVETIRSTVKGVQGALNDPSAPSVPSVPPAPSAAPPATPPPLPAPLAPVKEKAPVDRAPAPSPADSGSTGSGAPTVNGVTRTAGDAVRNVVGSVTGAAAETVRRAPASAGSPDGGPLPVPGGDGQVSGLGRGDDAGAPGADPGPIGAAASSAAEASARETRRAGDVASSPSLSVTAGKVVELQRWIARVWPGIPLIGEAGDGAAARVIEAGLLGPAEATVRELLLGAVASATASAGDSPLATLPPAARDRYMELLGVMSTDWKRILYRIALAVLLALLAFTVWKEFRSVLRPRLP